MKRADTIRGARSFVVDGQIEPATCASPERRRRKLRTAAPDLRGAGAATGDLGYERPITF